MKLCDCFKIGKAMQNKKQHTLLFVLGLAFTFSFFNLTSCAKHDEISFRGTVIDARECSASYTEPNIGYVVQLQKPDSIGKPYDHNGNTYQNVVILYEPDRRIYKNDHIKGTFYLDNKYSRANCSLHWTDYDLPEGVFTSVSVD